MGVSKNYLDSATNGTFHAGGRVALSNAVGSSIARMHTLKKSKPIKEKAGTGKRKSDGMSPKYKKKGWRYE